MKRFLISTLLGLLPLIGSAQDYAQPPGPIQTPIQQTPYQQTPVQQTPYQQAPVQQTPMQQMPVQQAQLPASNAPVGDPNYYGQVDLVNNTPPQVVYSTPAIVQPPPPGIVYQPVYLRVPPVYYQNWPQYCGYYNACYYPVYFVQDSWYIGIYSPWYRRYYPYGRPGFVAHVYYNPHWGGGYHDHGEHGEHGGHHDDHR